MSEHKEDSSNADELRRRLDLVSKRLEALEKIILKHPQYAELAPLFRLTKATVDLYENPLKMIPTSKQAEALLEVEITLMPPKIKIGEEFALKLELSNVGTMPIFLLGVEDFSPKGFRVTSSPSPCRLKGSYLDTGRRLLDTRVTEVIELKLTPFEPGAFLIKPKVIYADTVGRQRSCEPEAATINVYESILPNRVKTGHLELDRALMGGIPQKYAVILESISCDEKDSIIKSFLKTGVEQDEIVLFLTREWSEAESFAERFQSTFYLILCNPQADRIIQNLPNVLKLKGVENLNEINIAMAAALRKLGKQEKAIRRACIEIVSDVLLQHHVVNTRRWLAGLLPQLKAQGFNTLAVMNPEMHSPEEVHAILGLFDGEIRIYEKDTTGRLLKVKKLIDQRYLNVEFPL